MGAPQAQETELGRKKRGLEASSETRAPRSLEAHPLVCASAAKNPSESTIPSVCPILIKPKERA